MNEHGVRSLTSQVEAAVSGAIDRALPAAAGADPVVRRSEHADFQSNAALVLAKRARARPTELAGAMSEVLRYCGPRPRRQAFQDPLRRHRQAHGPAGRGG
ncbi:MAG: hypothetical protein ABIZ05_17275 [Pseudonocardiaceae bacterium]